jgi:hypothetical protein
MRPTTKALIVFGLLALLPGVADGQAMVEHALSAAGGSAAGVAGKAVSNGIDSIFRKVNQVTGLAAQTGTLAPARMPAAGVAPAGAVATTADKTTCPRAGKPAPQPEPSLAMPIPSPPPEPAEPVPSTAAEIARIEAGASRQDVLARLGKPSARITIPDGDRLVEIYQYAAKGERLGSLRFTDGLVSR